MTWRTRRVAILGVAGCTLIVLVCWAWDVAVACLTDIFPEIGAQAAAAERRQLQHENFRQEFDAIARKVALGRQSLRVASRAIEQYARQHNPVYLVQIETEEPGSTMSTKIAGLVLAHVKSTGSGVGLHVDAARQADLMREFEQMLADETEIGVTNRSNPQVSP